MLGKLKYSIFLGLIISGGLVNARKNHSRQHCTQEMCDKNHKTCECFCAYKCGYRKQEKNDSLRTYKGVCLCKKRDENRIKELEQSHDANKISAPDDKECYDKLEKMGLVS